MKVPLDKFESWLINKNLKPRTVQNYLYYFNKFSFLSFDQETVSRFLSESSNRNTIARSFLLNYQKFLSVNSDELEISLELKSRILSVELPKLTGREKVRLVYPIPEYQIQLIEDKLETQSDKIKLNFSYYCGLRLGELMKARLISFNWEEWKRDPSKMGECRVFGKGDKEGIALVPAKVMIMISRFIRNTKFEDLNSFLFVDPGSKYNFNSLARTWQKRLSAAAVSAGVSKLDQKGNIIKETAVHPHRLRHAYATHLIIDLHMDMVKVKELLRHSDISSTQIYTYVSKQNLKDDLENTL